MRESLQFSDISNKMRGLEGERESWEMENPAQGGRVAIYRPGRYFEQFERGEALFTECVFRVKPERESLTFPTVPK